MTTAAMIAGMMPIALGFGGDASFRQPMAVAVIGGLVSSTALSLLVVPVVFAYVDGIEHWFRNLRRPHGDGRAEGGSFPVAEVGKLPQILPAFCSVRLSLRLP